MFQKKKENMIWKRRSLILWTKVLLFVCLSLLILQLSMDVEHPGSNPFLSDIPFVDKELEMSLGTFSKPDARDKINTFLEEYLEYPEQIRLIQVDESVLEINYIEEPPPEPQIVFGGQKETLEANRKLVLGNNSIFDASRLLKSPTGVCRKLLRLGGEIHCLHNSSQSVSVMDGQKYICVDPELQVITGVNRTKECVVLSFGVNTDISFDIDARDMNCEVFMFDMNSKYNNSFAAEDEYVTFFEAALSHERFMGYVSNYNRTVLFGTLDSLAFEHGLENRLVNILKIDIEGSEWKVLRSIAKSPYLNYVGQIAVEVHGLNFSVSLDHIGKERLSTVMNETFQFLQEAGFERISYFDNLLSPGLKVDGNTFFSAGELLMVNRNWYNKRFREDGSEIGLNFHQL